MGSKIRIFYASDIHGSEKCYRKFLNTPKVYGVNVLILGGDITGKMVIPIIEQRDGSYETEFMGSKITIKKQEELESVIKIISDCGAYPYICDEDTYEHLSMDKSYLDTVFKDLICKRLENWIRLAEDRLANSNVEIYVMPGNDDYPYVCEILSSSNLVVNPEEKIVEICGGYEMLSLGFSNITSWKAPRDIPEEMLKEKLEVLVAKMKNINRAIFNIHVPPYNTVIDLAPLLDQNLKPVSSGGEMVMTHVGSIAVRKAIEVYQPLLGLHGHIHESKGVERIGKTICINPSSDYLAGNLQGAVITLEDGKVKSYVLTIG
jgi:Icc-related predicted phosphoesterase